MVMRNVLSATAGKWRTRVSASIGRTPSNVTGRCFAVTRFTLRTMRGGLPSRTWMGMSMGLFLKCSSWRTSWLSPVATPMNATGQRSRAHSPSKNWRPSGRSART